MIFLKLFFTFFKIGLFTFGGGYAMLPFIQEEVLANGWAAEADLINFIAISESTPGPFAINMATYVGAEAGGVFGAVCATLGVVMPSFLVILIVAKCYEKFKESRIVRGCMTGLKPAVIGLIGAAILSVVVTVFAPSQYVLAAAPWWEMFKSPALYVSAVIFVGGAVLAFRKVHPIIIICLAAACGIAAGYLGLFPAV